MEKIKIFFGKNYKTILFVSLILFIFFWVNIKINNTNNDDYYQRKLDSLTIQNENIYQHQRELETNIQDIKKEVEQIDNNITKIKMDKTKIGKKYHEEINRVDKYSERELDSFFSNRYK
jgi:septal ring factor EnvC (AmiA/AmiB activator)